MVLCMAYCPIICMVRVEAMTERLKGNDAFRWIVRSGWSGLCPHCGKGAMFKRWLKLEDRCPNCGLDYSFASPDDGPAFFSLCIVAFPLVFVAVWLQVAFSPPFWVHLLTSFPLLAFSCIGVLQPIKGWLVASQFVNNAQEAGTERLWSELNERARKED